MFSKVWIGYFLFHAMKLLDVSTAIDKDCNEILGIQSSKANLTASTSRLPLTTFGPQQARLHNTHAWCAATANADQYLDIDLGLVTMIKSIAIQGNPDDDEFVKTFSLSYAVLEGRWLTYLESGAKRIFPGNSNSGEVTIQTLQTTTAARYVRITPETWFSHLCIRTELYGCEAKPTLPLGMMSGGIPDSHITASSSWSDNLNPVTHGRLHWTKYGSNQCWAAGTSNTNQWLQIDLSRMESVTAIATQGRHGNSQWVTSYFLSYGNDSTSLTEYLEGGVRKVFAGNSDRETVVRHVLPTVIYARFVRFNPLTWYDHISMRVEVYTYGRASPADLGIDVEDKEIPDNQITASSYYDSGHAPYLGRLNNAISTPSWCPSTLSGNHWLQFDFGHVMLVTGIVTQGRGNGAARWVTGYQVKYSLDNINWVFYKDTGASQVKTFQGNTNDIGYVTRTLDRDIEARWIRILPMTWIPSNNILCLRSTILGRRKGPLGSPVFANQAVSFNIITYEHQDVMLQCKVVGDSPITVTWTHKGRLIQTSSSNTHLSLVNVNKTDQGIYLCTATNALGSNTKTFHLQVKDSSDVCTNPRFLDDDSRLSNTLTPTLIQDDTNLNESDWYVFRGTRGYYRIPNKCLPQNRCGAEATGYMEGTFPTLDDGIVKRKLCFHANGNCCQFSTYIYVRNCYFFYVYKLKKLTLSWSARHCVERNHNENPSKMFQVDPQPFVLYNHVFRRLYQVSDSLTCMRYCMFNAKCQTFNYNQKVSTCELNNATAEEYPQHKATRPGYKYYYQVKLIT